MTRHAMNRHLFLSVGLVLVTVAGCGTGEYERRMKAGLTELSQRSDFSEFYDAAAVGDTPIMVRVPKLFTKTPLVKDVEVDGQLPNLKRVVPFSPVLAGLRYTYEDFVEDSTGGKISFYCYLAVNDNKTNPIKNPARHLRAQLQTAFPDSSDEVTTVQCKTPEGRTIDWQRTGYTGMQEFYYIDPTGQGSFREMPGRSVFFISEQGDYTVFIGLRAPDSLQGSVNVDKLGALIAGSMQVRE